MRYIFTIWLPVGIVLAITHIAGALDWYTPITAFFSAVVMQFLYEFYIREKWSYRGWVYAYEPRTYYYILNRMRYERLATTQVGLTRLYYHDYWRHENLQSQGIFGVRDIIWHYWFFSVRDRLSMPQGTPEVVSESVASGEIKSTGTSVSVDDVIAKINAQLEMESE